MARFDDPEIKTRGTRQHYYSSIMASERMRGRIEGLLDEVN